METLEKYIIEIMAEASAKYCVIALERLDFDAEFEPDAKWATELHDMLEAASKFTTALGYPEVKMLPENVAYLRALSDGRKKRKLK